MDEKVRGLPIRGLTYDPAALFRNRLKKQFPTLDQVLLASTLVSYDEPVSRDVVVVIGPHGVSEQVEFSWNEPAAVAYERVAAAAERVCAVAPPVSAPDVKHRRRFRTKQRSIVVNKRPYVRKIFLSGRWP